MAITCLQVHCPRAFVLSATLTLAACSSSSTNNDSAQGGNGDAASAKSGGSTAGVDAAVASTGGSTASSDGSTASTGGSTVSSGGTTSLGGSTAGVDASVTTSGDSAARVDGSTTRSDGVSSSDGMTGSGGSDVGLDAPVTSPGDAAAAADGSTASHVVWADWTSAQVGNPNGSVTGTLNFGAVTVNVTYSGEVFNTTQLNGTGTDYYSPTTTYTTAVVPNPPLTGMVTFVGGAAVDTISFSPAISNPILAIMSQGSPGVNVDFAFDSPFQILSTGPGWWGGGPALTQTGNTLHGAESDGLIQFNGTFSSISWTASTGDTYYNGITVGAVAPATGTGGAAGTGGSPDSGACAASGVSLITNGSFELPIVTVGSYQTLSTGDPPSGWTVVGAAGSVAPISTTFTQNGFSFPAEDGSQALDLTGASNSATGVSQTVLTTPGVMYQLSFWVGNVVNPDGIFGTTSTVDVLVNGTQLLAAENTQGTGTTTLSWQEFTVRFTATSSATSVEFLNADPSTDTSNFIDNVVLVGCGL